MSEHKLSDNEEKLFKSLEHTMTPPPHLEQRIIGQLKAEGHIKKKKWSRRLMYEIAASFAAAILLFYGGVLFEQSRSDAGFEIDPNAGYMLILHEDQSFRPVDEMEMFVEYSNWMRNTINRGVKISGQELKQEAALVQSDKQVVMLQGDEGERTTGYFVIEAASMQEAIDVALANPHISYGGIIEVKPFIVR